MRLLIPLLIAPLLSGCVLVALGVTKISLPADEKTIRKFDELCRGEIGLHVYEPTPTVKGVFDASSDHECEICEYALAKAKYDFVEFEIAPENYHEWFYAKSYVDGPGLYRATLRPMNHPDCEIFYRYHSRSGNPEITAKKLAYAHGNLNGHCMTATQISNTKTKYKYIKYKRTTISDNRIFKRETIWKNSENEDIYAQYTQYYLVKTLLKGKGGTHHGETSTCPKSNNKYNFYDPPPIDKVFQPAR
ncbi:MAG: hypothetical protein RIB80_01845 [Rhodospirillales bacterium]